MNPLRAIVYVSCATRAMNQPDLDRLLANAQYRNARDGITGCLLYCDGNFIQLIEGPAEPLQQVYTSICADTRHAGIYQIVDEPIGSREFSGWAMGYASADLQDFTTLHRSLLNGIEAAQASARPVDGRRLLHDFWVQHGRGSNPLLA
ncbi:MAG: BLUF domain-containing protein [Burkholderiaceae bacterium]